MDDFFNPAPENSAPASEPAAVASDPAAEFLGGDKNRIMIFGKSAGGESISAQMMSPESSKYFTRAISQSGPGLWNWTPVQSTPEINPMLGELCKKLTHCCFDYDTMDELVENMRGCDAFR